MATQPPPRQSRAQKKQQMQQMMALARRQVPRSPWLPAASAENVLSDMTNKLQPPVKLPVVQLSFVKLDKDSKKHHSDRFVLHIFQSARLSQTPKYLA